MTHSSLGPSFLSFSISFFFLLSFLLSRSPFSWEIRIRRRGPSTIQDKAVACLLLAAHVAHKVEEAACETDATNYQVQLSKDDKEHHRDESCDAHSLS